MRHGWTVVPALLALALGLVGFTTPARSGEPADDRLGERIVPVVLLMRSDIQADLKLKPHQVAECFRAAQALQRKAARLIGRKDPSAVAARREIDEELSQWISKQLSPEQLERLDQIDLQWEGAAAMLSRPFLDESLALTPAQKNMVKDCLDKSKKQRAQGRWTYQDHANLTREAIAVLTENQSRLWFNLMGPECRFVIAGKAQAPTRPTAARAAGSRSTPPNG